MNEQEAAALTSRTISRLRAARRARGYSADHLADLSGVSRNVISSLETRRPRIYLDQVARLADALGVSMVDLLADAPLRLEVATVEID